MQLYAKALEEILKRGYDVKISSKYRGFYTVTATKHDTTLYRVALDYRVSLREIYKEILLFEGFQKVVERNKKDEKI